MRAALASSAADASHRPRRRLPSSVTSLVGFAASTIALAVMLPVLVHALGPKAYGAWALTIGLVNYINIFDFGLSLCVTRFVAQSRVADERHAREAVTIGFLGMALISTLLVIGTYSASSWWEHMTGVTGTAAAVRIAGIAAALTLFAKVAQSALEGANRVGLSRSIQSANSIAAAAISVAVVEAVSGTASRLSMLAETYVLVAAVTLVVVVGCLVWEWGRLPLAFWRFSGCPAR